MTELLTETRKTVTGNKIKAVTLNENKTYIKFSNNDGEIKIEAGDYDHYDGGAMCNFSKVISEELLEFFIEGIKEHLLE